MEMIPKIGPESYSADLFEAVQIDTKISLNPLTSGLLHRADFCACKKYVPSYIKTPRLIAKYHDKLPSAAFTLTDRNHLPVFGSLLKHFARKPDAWLMGFGLPDIGLLAFFPTYESVPDQVLRVPPDKQDVFYDFSVVREMETGHGKESVREFNRALFQNDCYLYHEKIKMLSYRGDPSAGELRCPPDFVRAREIDNIAMPLKTPPFFELSFDPVGNLFYRRVAPLPNYTE